MQNTKTIILNAEQVAEAIEARYGQYLNQPLPGIYLKHGIAPVMVPGRAYHMLQKTTTGLVSVPVTDENSITSPVFDEEGNTVISKFFIKNKLFSVGPDRPVMASILVRQIIEAAVNRSSKYYKGAQLSMDDVIKNSLRKDLFEVGVSHDHPRYADLLFAMEEDIYSLCSQIKSELYEINDAAKQFVQVSPWAMIRIFDVNGLDVGLERGMDYRAYTWHINYNVPIGPEDQ